jgi:transposase
MRWDLSKGSTALNWNRESLRCSHWVRLGNVKLAFVDGGYAGDETQRAAYEATGIRLSVVKRTGREVKGFIVLPKCWIVERTLGWANRARRIAKDFETLIASSQAWFMLAMSFLLIRRIARDYKKAA